jgi:hypothetical protein
MRGGMPARTGEDAEGTPQSMDSVKNGTSKNGTSQRRPANARYGISTIFPGTLPASSIWCA